MRATTVAGGMFGQRLLVAIAIAGVFGARIALAAPVAPQPTRESPQQQDSTVPGRASGEQGKPGGTSSDATDEGQSAAVREQAKALYEEGLAAYRAGSYPDAVDKLLQADRLMPNAAFSYNIALVYEAMGDNRSALRWLRSYLRQKGGGTDSATIPKLRRLESSLQQRGLQQITVLSNPPGATLKLDGHAIGITPFTTEVAPGTHEAVLFLDGHEPAARTFELRPDRSMDVEIDLKAVETVPTPAAPSSPSSQLAPSPPGTLATSNSATTVPPAPEQRARGIRPLTWITAGVGAALLGGASYFEWRRQQAEDDARSASQRDYQSEYDRMHAPQTAARVLAAAGSAVLATSVVLLTLDLTRGRSRAATSFGACGDGFCATLRSRF